QVGVLVDRRHLIGTVRTGEVPDREARASRVVLSNARVEDALGPSVDELLPIRLEGVDAHVEVVVLVDGEQTAATGGREGAREEGLRTAPRIGVAAPPALRTLIPEARPVREPHEYTHRRPGAV